MVSASDVKPDLTILADVAANVFAICLLILIALLVTKQRSVPPPPLPPGPVEAREVLEVVERAPLDARAMVEHLRARLADDGGLAVDLLPGGLAVVLGGRVVAGDGHDALEAGLRAADPRRAVRLHVFDAEHYGSALARLQADGRHFAEMSVPRALRRPDGRGWSSAFVALRSRADDAAAFRSGLARLLGGGDGPTAAGGAFSPSSELPARPTLAERLQSLFGLAAALLVPLLGAGAVLLIEARDRRHLMPSIPFPGVPDDRQHPEDQREPPAPAPDGERPARSASAGEPGGDAEDREHAGAGAHRPVDRVLCRIPEPAVDHGAREGAEGSGVRPGRRHRRRERLSGGRPVIADLILAPGAPICRRAG